MPFVLIGIAAYTILTGASPSAVRAALMAALALVAARVGRVPDPLTSVMLAAAVMVAFDPQIVVDVGFLLSFSASLGLILLHPRISDLLAHTRAPAWVREPVGLTLAATISALPVTLVVFQQISLISPIAHVFATPFVPMTLLTSVLFAASLPIPGLASVTAWLVWAPSAVLVEIARLTAAAPGASVFLGRVPLPGAFFLAGVLLGWGLWDLPELVGLRTLLVTSVVARRRLLTVLIPVALSLAFVSGAFASSRAPRQLEVDLLASSR